MTNHAVHWSEGLFISPHHFQLSERRLREEMALAQQWHIGYAYGIRKIEIDLDALSNWRVSISSLHIRLRDRTFLRYPEDSILGAVDIPRTAFRNQQERLMVHVGVPTFQLGRKNAEEKSPESTARYILDSQEIEDENQAGNAMFMEVRWLNARILLGDEELSGYETLPVMRLRLGSVADAPPEIDTDYIPPILACDAWPYLHDRIIGSAADQLGRMADELAQKMDRGVAFESGHREDLECIFKLHSINMALGYLVNLPLVRGVHPLPAYMEMCRILGEVAIFRPERKFPKVPAYDHDDLGGCFHALRKLLDIRDPERKYVKRPFVGAGLQMRVQLDPEWLSAGWSFYMGIDSVLSFNEVQNALMRLDLKLGSSDVVETIFRGGKGGVKFTPDVAPPRDFPGAPWTYWKLDRGADAWQRVEETLILGMRFNERQIIGSFNNEEKIQIRTDQGQLVALSFALFAMPNATR